MKITTKLVLRAMGKYAPARYSVAVNGVEVGFVEKYNNTRTETHPWKAWFGMGESTEFVKSFYTPDGGKRAAIRAVVNGLPNFGRIPRIPGSLMVEKTPAGFYGRTNLDGVEYRTKKFSTHAEVSAACQQGNMWKGGVK